MDLISTSSIMIEASFGLSNSKILVKALSSVDLPDPVLPTTPILSP